MVSMSAWLAPSCLHSAAPAIYREFQGATQRPFRQGGGLIRAGPACFHSVTWFTLLTPLVLLALTSPEGKEVEVDGFHLWVAAEYWSSKLTAQTLLL